MKRIALASAFLALLSVHAMALDIAGLQPLAPNAVISTFTAESLSRSQYSMELFFERSREPDYYRAIFKAAYGITDQAEIQLSLPYVWRYDSAFGERDGSEDLSIGLKYRVLNEGKYYPAAAVIVDGSIPSGRDQFSTDGCFGGGLVLSKKLGPFDASLNMLYHVPFQSHLNDEIVFLGGLRLHATHNTWLLAELIARKSYFSDSYDQVEGRLGYRIRTTDIIYTTIGGGTDFRNRHPEYRIFFSVNVTGPAVAKQLKRVYEQE